MPNYLFLKKIIIINFMDFFKNRVFLGGKKNNLNNLKKKVTNLEVIRDNL